VIFPTDYIPRGLNDPNEAGKYIGNFNPNNDDSNNNGILDGAEDYDNDLWTDPHNPDPNERGNAKPCNNTVEHQKHSDPTDSNSVPLVEYRARGPTETETESESEGTTSSGNDDLDDFEELNIEYTMNQQEPEAEKIIAVETSSETTQQAVDIRS
jgi:hypothetical protein